ncbi:unnamed protein product, partial [Mesorhabditis spiculigera]
MENGGDPTQDLRGAPEEVVEMDLSEQDDEMSDIVSDKDVESMDTFDRLPSVQNNTQYSAEEANDPDDLYRPEGMLELEIDKFSEFARGPADVQQRLSKPVFVRGLPWKILAIPRDQNRCSGARTNKALGFFLQCNGDSDMVTWSCIASATLKVVNQNGGESHQRRISHTFYPKENDWGYSQFLSCDQLLNPESGYIRNDMIRLEVLVSADAPHGVQWDSKKHAGYIGLKNQGATCYMNSLLQAFYFTNQLRKAVYEMPTEEDDSESSVALAMQRVFFDLQYSDKPVGTKKLTKSFGWDSLDSFLQHDVQELCRVLLDNLESKMKGTTVEDTIPHLFKGKMKSFIRCLNVDYESSHADDFYDVQLNVKGNNNILESFRDYVAPERLDGENKYDAGDYGLQPAEKGVKFLSFPPILHLQLMRFQYDAAMDANVKINDRLEFPERLDLNPFIEGKGEDEDYNYVLHAVLVHSGDFHGGHYVVFINTKLNQQHSCWCKFDDDVVSRSSFKDAVTANYGGEDPETLGRTYTNAYMLVYIRQSSLDKVLSPITDDDIPHHLRHRFEVERNEEAYRKKEKQEAHLYTDIFLIQEEKFQNHHGFDLFDARIVDEECSRERVRKKMTIDELYMFVAQRLFGNQLSALPMRNDFRLWLFSDNTHRDDLTHSSSLPRLRPTQLISREKKFVEDAFDSDRNLIFVETAPPSTRTLRPYDDKNEMLIFLKLYQPHLRTLTYVGHLMMKYREPLSHYHRTICELTSLPPDAKLSYYEEIAPDRVRMVTDPNAQMCTDGVITEIVDGVILIVQNDAETDTYNSLAIHTSELYNNIDIELVQNIENTQFLFQQIDITPPILTQIHLNWGVPELCNFIGKKINFDPERILLWKMSAYNEKPTNFLNDQQYRNFKVKDVLGLSGVNTHDPRRHKRYRLVYTKMPVPVADLENRKQMKIQMMDEKLNVSDITLFPPRHGTVGDLLEEAKREFKFAENGTGQLRLVYVGVSPATTRVFNVLENSLKISDVLQKTVNSSMHTQARVEEIPKDQLRIGANEHLMPVAHYDKEPTRMFGVPFLFKVSDREPLATVHERLRQVLDVPEKDFEKYKFALLLQNKVIRHIDLKEEGKFVNLAEMRAVQPNNALSAFGSMPLLGIDHLNKSRGARSGHITEKPIIIHN